MTKVKICGITNLEDALLSAKFGADALGFNFYAKSPRCIAPEKAREIIEQLPANILNVGVFVNESLDKIVKIASTAKLDALQLHGEETPEFVKELKAKTNLEIIKAFRVSSEFKSEDVLQYETDAILLDAYNPQEHGGTGETFDWKFAKKLEEFGNAIPKLYLAGGLWHQNVVSAIHWIHPFAVDTCSKIESNKGQKDKIKLINFIKVVKNLDIFELYKTQNFKVRNIYELFALLHSRPALFTAQKSILQLRGFLYGFDFAFKLQESEFDFLNFHGFHDYTAKHFGWIESTSGWANIILKECNNDEEQALDVFFALLEEFKLETEDLGLEIGQWERASDEDFKKVEQNL